MKKTLVSGSFSEVGFTFIELLIVLSIILISSSIGLASFNSYNQQLKLKTEAKKLANILELAKKKSESSELIPTLNPNLSYCNDFNGYKVELTSTSYTLKYTCNHNDTIIQTYNFPSSITYTGGNYDFVFPALGLNTNITLNSIILKNNNINDTNKCINISISVNGIIQINDNLISCP